MPLWDDAAEILNELAPKGWAALFARHGLDILAWPLEAILQARLTAIDRQVPGFDDFSRSGRRAIEAGDPARSLLYHALASPRVHPTPDGTQAPLDHYPTLAQLDCIENLIYSLLPGSAGTMRDLVPAVFAYEYRPGARSAHGAHADMVFSRTGIARLGTQPKVYNPAMRCFAGPSEAGSGVPVMPARYGLFLARPVTGPDSRFLALAGGRQADDGGRTFLVPVRKLFNGRPWPDGPDLTVRLRHRHVNEKLKRLCESERGAEVGPEFDLSKPPFRIESADDLPESPIGLQHVGASGLVCPKHGDLIQIARQPVGPANEDKAVTFKVPPAALVHSRINRRYTSLLVADNRWELAYEALLDLFGNVMNWLGVGSRFPRPRNAPEFVNIRHSFQGDVLTDMRHDPPEHDRFMDATRWPDAGYRAVLFADGCADGCVSAVVIGERTGTVIPAYSVVAPPDFFPCVDQIEVTDWLGEAGVAGKDQFKAGGPDPLCFGRLPACLDLVDPVTGGPAFSRNDNTVAAMLSPNNRGRAKPARGPDLPGRTSFLSDASSNVFAPGWDVTYAADEDGEAYYATYGLGSPFPEDVKLCAAANSFWPAVSPDAARTFGRRETPTAMPLTDHELGYHEDHPWALAGQVAPSRGWDGEYGPFLDGSGEWVNCANIDRSDYVAAVRDGLFDFRRLAAIDASEMTSRMDCLRHATRKVDRAWPANAESFLVSFEKVEDWSQIPGADGLTGPGYRFVFATGVKDPEPLSVDPARSGMRVNGLVRCRVDANRKTTREKLAAGVDALALYAL